MYKKSLPAQRPLLVHFSETILFLGCTVQGESQLLVKWIPPLRQRWYASLVRNRQLCGISERIKRKVNCKMPDGYYGYFAISICNLLLVIIANLIREQCAHCTAYSMCFTVVVVHWVQQDEKKPHWNPMVGNFRIQILKYGILILGTCSL